MSRKANTFAALRDLAADMAANFRGAEGVLDGEIVCLDEHGYSQFEDLMFRTSILNYRNKRLDHFSEFGRGRGIKSGG